MKSRKFLVVIGFTFSIIVLFYLFLSYFVGDLKLPGFTVYKTYPNVFGGCFNICEGKEKLIRCNGDPNDLTDTFATCRYYCIGNFINTCRP